MSSGCLAFQHHVPGCDLLVDRWLQFRFYFIDIQGNTRLQTVPPGQSVAHPGQPGRTVVDVTQISRVVDVFTPAVTEPDAVVEVRLADVAFEQHTHEVNGHDEAAELHSLRTPDRGLQPGAMVKSRVPVAERRVITTPRELELIGEVVPYKQPLNLELETFVLAGRCGQLGKRAESLINLKIELPYSLAEHKSVVAGIFPFTILDLAEEQCRQAIVTNRLPVRNISGNSQKHKNYGDRAPNRKIQLNLSHFRTPGTTSDQRASLQSNGFVFNVLCREAKSKATS